MDAVTHVLAGYVLALGVAMLAARLAPAPNGRHSPAQATRRTDARWAAAAGTRQAGGADTWTAAAGTARAERARTWAAVAGAAALAPDLDVLLSPLSLVPALYPLQHRGATHSILGAPIMAAAVMAVLVRMGRRWRRFSVFTWRRDLAVPLLLGAWSHLVLDVVTHQGAPLAWPFADGRTSLEIYYWIIWWLAPISFVPLLMRFRRRWDDRHVGQAALVVLAIVLIVGGIRLDARPEGEMVFATREADAWAVASPEGNGSWRMELVEDGQVRQTRIYVRQVPGGAEPAVQAVLSTNEYRGFRFGSSAPQVVQAEAGPDGWNVTVIDIVQRFEAQVAPGWVPEWRQDAGLFKARVADGEVRIERAFWR